MLGVKTTNYVLLIVDIFNTVVIYDEISETIFAIVPLTDPFPISDFFIGLEHAFRDDPDYPKIESKIIDTKTGILEGSDDYASQGRVETPFEEDDAELNFLKV